jgi:3-oxoacyl-[acyl-carrier-protein] synthase I
MRTSTDNQSAPVYFSTPGVICSAGNGCEELWTACTAGSQTGIKKIESLSGKEFYVGRIADENLKKTNARFDMRLIRIADAALNQLNQVIGAIIEKYGKHRVAVCVGSCDNGTEFSFEAHRKYLFTGKFPGEYSLEMQGADYPATYVSEKYEVTGPSIAFSTACSSSAGAIIKAAEFIRSGIADAVIVGGVDVISDTVLLGFDSLEAVSSGITNPFSVNRLGITLGEGAAFFVMTKDVPAGSVAVRLLGYGETADAYHMTSPDPEGTCPAEAMRQALRRAGLSAQDIDYVNLHGTGTKFNDSMEAKAVNNVFRDLNTPVSTTKPLMGHTLGAAGALEAAVCWTAIMENKTAGEIFLPVQVWDGEQDPSLPVINIISKGKPAVNRGRVNVCMSNSFAFGGSNVSLILGV